MLAWFEEQNDEKGIILKNKHWLGRLAYLTDVYGMLNRLNCGLQNEDSNIFSATSQISSFKQKLQTIKKEVETNNFSSFKFLHESMSTSNSGN